MKLQEYQAVILDMDGVITQTARVHAWAWKCMFDGFLKNRDGESFEPFDIERDYAQYVDGKPRYDGVQSFLQSRGIEIPFGNDNDGSDRTTICGLGNRKNEFFRKRLEQDGVKVYDDTIEQIGRWKSAGLKVAVITSSRNGEAVLKAAGVLDRFDIKVDGNDLARENIPGKPAPDIFWHAAEQLGVTPKQAIVIEDAIAGVQAGRAGQFGLIVGLQRGEGSGELRQAGADVVVRDLRELETTLEHATGKKSMPTPKSALEHFDEIKQQIHGHRVALFLDYDGTLTPIVRRPEDATLSESMRSLISELSQHCAVAIISGRDRRNVEQMVQLQNLVYAGSHGFDIHGPNGLDMQQEEAQDALPELDEAEQTLRERLKPIVGAHIERKRYAITVHYREVEDENNVRQIESVIDEVVPSHPALRKRGGKKIFELQPDVAWDKGQALLWVRKARGVDHSGVVTIYVGDDVTDEDAFQVLSSLENGIGIRVDSPTTQTHASYFAYDCDEVHDFLQSLLQILRQHGTVSNE